MRAFSSMSLTSRVSLVTLSDWRVASMRIPRNSGCVYCADQFVLYCGSTVAVVAFVVPRLLLSVRTYPPPPHLMFCVMPPLKIVVPVLTDAPVPPPAVLLVDGFACDSVDTCDVSATLYVDAMLAYARSLIWGLRRVTSILRL